MKKFGWKTYCSLECQKTARNKQQKFTCFRPSCDKVFTRSPHEILGAALYCSQACAAIVNNSKYPKRGAVIRKCLYCAREFKENGSYCSRKCKDISQIMPAEEVMRKIKEFYLKHGRIPLKREFLSAKAARLRFGSWNKAIEAAGYKSNPVMFALQYLSKDGHKCNSFSEKIIDDWLYEKNIKHKRSVPYPGRQRLTTDFVTDGNWIEFFGLSGEVKKYDALLKKKLRLVKKYKLPLTAIYPKHLFPQNQLATILKVK